MVDTTGAILNIIMVEPGVDPVHEEGHTFIPIPDGCAADHTGAWTWTKEKGFIDSRPPDPRIAKQVEAF